MADLLALETRSKPQQLASFSFRHEKDCKAEWGKLIGNGKFVDRKPNAKLMIINRFTQIGLRSREEAARRNFAGRF